MTREQLIDIAVDTWSDTEMDLLMNILETPTEEQHNCKYCHKPFEEIAVLEYDLASVGIGQNNELYGGGTGDDEYGYNEVHAKINYCPMCGRKLSD